MKLLGKFFNHLYIDVKFARNTIKPNIIRTIKRIKIKIKEDFGSTSGFNFVKEGNQKFYNHKPCNDNNIKIII